jgi:hypothetical protein
MTRQLGPTGDMPGAPGDNIERAEQRLDRIAAQLNRFFSKGAKPFVLRTVGRVREEAEDVVAEAKSVRSGKHT